MKQFTALDDTEYFDKDYSKYKDAKIVLIPVPYDKTSTYRDGSRRGPEAMLEASTHMEVYDIETKSTVYKLGIHTLEPLTGFNSPDEMVSGVSKAVLKELNKGKFVTLFGGEHSISIGSIREFHKKYPDLTVIQIDAHPDLRPEFEGSKYNHGCSMYEFAQEKKGNLIQVGIRSMDTEREVLDVSRMFFARDILQSKNDKWIHKILAKSTKNVYITLDLDALDPSIMPSTGTPEPGGMDWYTITKLLKKICEKKNVVGFDIVELSPKKDVVEADFLAAKLYYKILSYIFYKE